MADDYPTNPAGLRRSIEQEAYRYYEEHSGTTLSRDASGNRGLQPGGLDSASVRTPSCGPRPTRSSQNHIPRRKRVARVACDSKSAPVLDRSAGSGKARKLGGLARGARVAG